MGEIIHSHDCGTFASSLLSVCYEPVMHEMVIIFGTLGLDFMIVLSSEFHV